MATFKILKRSKGTARTGEIKTSHGIIHTPAFLPVGTMATVKALDSQDLNEIGVEAVLANTYHLHLRPGEEIIKKQGGLAKFMAWNGPACAGRPTMTDSGGFQVFSLGIGGDVKLLSAKGRSSSGRKDGPRERPASPKTASRGGDIAPMVIKINDRGVVFRSPFDGKLTSLTPESSIKIQEDLGADLIVGFDDLESPRANYEETKKSLERTNRWLARSKKAHHKKDQLLYGVTHGGRFTDLRLESIKFVDQNFSVVALGGAHQDKQNMYEIVELTTTNSDPQKPRHMLGVGEIDDILNIISLGIDTFDCVIPTRLARMGEIFVSPPIGNLKNRFRFNITKGQWASSSLALDKNCACMVCENYTRAYINHLFRTRELLAYRLATYHNVYFFTKLMEKVRTAINDGQYAKLKGRWLK
ncbi:tRNA guanosine(34) transglycosylase Tgt [Candidatus Microgenomates bacterium]|nr:tRNA guanosine(34) transglycosylase Tgt [Candidatus Microgenomates bacterium]